MSHYGSYQQGLILPKTTGYGIKVDTVTPTFGYRDIPGVVTLRATGSNEAVFNVYRTPIRAYQFTDGSFKELFFYYHIPHDYVPGSDVYIHTHWSQIVVDTGGAAGVPGVCKWGFDISYAKGFGTPGGTADPFIAPFAQSVLQQASTTQYGHLVAEVAFTNAGGDATHIDRALIEVDGIVIARIWRDSTDVSDTLDQAPFMLFSDLHYQSTNIGTKNRAPNFYA